MYLPCVVVEPHPERVPHNTHTTDTARTVVLKSEWISLFGLRSRLSLRPGRVANPAAADPRTHGHGLSGVPAARQAWRGAMCRAAGHFTPAERPVVLPPCRDVRAVRGGVLPKLLLHVDEGLVTLARWPADPNPNTVLPIQ